MYGYLIHFRNAFTRTYLSFFSFICAVLWEEVGKNIPTAAGNMYQGTFFS